MIRGFREKDFLKILDKAAKRLPENKKKEVLSANFLLQVQNRWAEITSPLLAEHSLPCKLSQKRLQITADHGIYAQEIKLHSNEIAAKIRLMFSFSPERIEVKVGPLYEKSGKSSRAFREKSPKTKDIMSPKERLTADPGENNIHPNHRTIELLISLLKD